LHLKLFTVPFDFQLFMASSSLSLVFFWYAIG